MRSKNVIRIIIIVACLLLVPLIAMQFSDEVAWDLSDFVVAGILLLGTGLTYEMIANRGGNVAYRAAIGAALGSTLLLIWVNLAVGLIGNEDNPANTLYLGVIAIGLLGAILSRLKPQGLAYTLYAMAIAQILVPVIAFFIWQPGFSFGVVQTFGASGFFAILFFGAGLLFQRARNTIAK
ncbi:MAG: hypothetical protein NUV82_01160 [Candidatus Komeilibacteria bacterium]|nr:hypothetical protein [Candidatus Komeilibacteria bacterium]